MRCLALLLLLACTGPPTTDTGTGDTSAEDSASPTDSGETGDTEPARFLVDEDGDGFAPAGGDCNDDDVTIRIGMPEVACDAIDQDCDGVVDEGTACGDADGDGISPADGDCHDQDATVLPGGTEILLNGIDDDCDGTVDGGSLDLDGDGWDPGGDCDDSDAAISPWATEVPDGADEDCDGIIDEGTLAYDTDGDCACAQLGGVCTASSNVECTTLRTRDCDESDPTRFPGNPETADDVDNDCDGTIDEGTTASDIDGDGFTSLGGDCVEGDASTNPGASDENKRCGVVWPTCATVEDCDGDGSLAVDDCHDGAVEVRPGADELANGVDDDCDGTVDEGTDASDDDGDGTSELGGDCDDADADRSPALRETANGTDEDCDLRVDEGTTASDDDGDGMTEDQGDCDDSDPTIRRGLPEIEGNGVDDDCDGFSASAIDPDEDGFTPAGGDCLEGDGSFHPGAVEVADRLDNDCDGRSDEGTVRDDADNDGSCVGSDLDGDGVLECFNGSDVPGDCDDNDDNVCPGCLVIADNGKDNDCDGTVD